MLPDNQRQEQRQIRGCINSVSQPGRSIASQFRCRRSRLPIRCPQRFSAASLHCFLSCRSFQSPCDVVTDPSTGLTSTFSLWSHVRQNAALCGGVVTAEVEAQITKYALMFSGFCPFLDFSSRIKCTVCSGDIGLMMLRMMQIHDLLEIVGSVRCTCTERSGNAVLLRSCYCSSHETSREGLDKKTGLETHPLKE